MLTSIYEQYQNIKAHHQDLLKEADQERLAIEAMKAGIEKRGNAARILANVGRGLRKLGSRLEERYNDQVESVHSISQQSSAGGC